MAELGPIDPRILGNPIGRTPSGEFDLYEGEDPQEAIHGPKGLLQPEVDPDEELLIDPRANEIRLKQGEIPGMGVFDLMPTHEFAQHNLLPEIGREGIIPGMVNKVRRAFNSLRVQPVMGSATA
jgi:hypothetical protein